MRQFLSSLALATTLMAAIVIWGVNNIDVLEREVNEDLNQTSMGSLDAGVVVVDVVSGQWKSRSAIIGIRVA